jgi:ABC-type Fe3+-hydroxamate transport system substrate-binding protein
MIGAGSRLVGVTRYCTRPLETMQALPKVGGTKHVDLAAVDALAPDLIFANAEENSPEQVADLARRYRVHVSIPRRVADVPGVVREIALEAGVDREGENLAAEIETTRRSLEATPPRRRYRFACLIWKEPWMSVSDDTYVADLLKLAGGDNVFGGSDRRYPTVSPALVAASEPDLIFLPTEPYPFREKHVTELAPLFGNRPLRIVEGDDLCWHGARTRQGLQLAERLRSDYAR